MPNKRIPSVTELPKEAKAKKRTKLSSPPPPGGRFRAPGRGGLGRQPSGFGLGPGGECICHKCGIKVPHTRGVPCYEHKCHQCGSLMTRSK